MDFNVGNIVLYNDNKYLITEKSKEEFICIPLKDIEIKKIINYLDFNGIDFNNVITINSKEKIEYVANTTPYVVLFLLKKYKIFLTELEQKKNINIGSIITKDNKFYYIFSEAGQNWIVFELSKKQMTSSDKFILGNITYYTNYIQTIINKNDNFITVYTCKEGQIELLKRRRRAYQKIIFDNAIKADAFVVKIDELSDEEYTVKSKLGDKLICTSNYDLGHNDKRRHYFNSEDVVFVKVRSKRR